MDDRDPSSSDWSLATVRVQASNQTELELAKNGNRIVPLKSEEWAHLKKRGGFRTGAALLYRTHCNADEGSTRVELHLAYALVESRAVLLALQQQPGGILRGPVPALPVTIFTLPFVAHDGWTKRILAMNRRLAEGTLPFSVQKALGKRVSIHGDVYKFEITGPIANRRALLQIFSIDNMSKEGFLDWLCGEKGPKVEISLPDEQRYCQMLADLFAFKNWKACRLEGLAETSNDGHLAFAVRRICGERPERESCSRIPLGLTDCFLLMILKFIGPYKLLKRNNELQLGSDGIDLKNMITQRLEKLWSSQGIGTHEFEMRLQSLSEIAHRLLRSSSQGPDVPLHWAMHSKISLEPRSVFNNAVFEEVVISMATILCLLFGRSVMPHDIRNPVDAIQELFRRAG
jgi:hypothetical protein